MANCENKVSFYTESGRELKVQCGRTLMEIELFAKAVPKMPPK
mgnify:CR=1 FL=1